MAAGLGPARAVIPGPIEVESSRIIASRFGGPDVLRFRRQMETISPGPMQARIAIEACGIGYTDLAMRRGRYYAYRGKPPLTPGYSFVGIVDRLGPGVTQVQIGDRVTDLSIVGGYANYIVRPAAGLVKLPEDADPLLAAYIPLAWMTAWQMLKEVARPPPGSAIFVSGISGGVGTALLELGRQSGLRVIGTCSRGNFDRVLARDGMPIDYRDPEAVAKLRVSCPEGITAAFDAIGGDGLRVALSALVPRGVLVSYGAQSIVDGHRSPLGFLSDIARILLSRKRPRLRLYLITRTKRKDEKAYAQASREIYSAFVEGSFEPPVITPIRLADVPAAHAQLEDGSPHKNFVIDMRWAP